MPEGLLNSHSPTRRGRRLRRAAFAGAMLGLTALGVVGVRRASLAREEESHSAAPGLVQTEPGTTRAKRGPLSLVLTQRGSLDCVRKTTLFSKVEWVTKITSILPEGSFVKKGDVVAQLDVSKLREEYGDEKADVARAEAALNAAQNLLTLQKVQNEQLVADAKLKKELAELSFEGYKAAEYPYQVRDLERQIAAAADALHTAEEKYAFAERLFEKGYKQAVELDRERLALKQAERKHADLVESLRVLEKHTHGRTLASLEGDQNSARWGLTRAEALAERLLTIRQMQISSLTRSLLRQKQQFDWATRMLKACEIVAPHDGQVVYAPQNDSSEVIAEGAMVKFLQPIVTIPDRSAMKVSVRVHETQRKYLEIGLPAEIRTDADPRRKLTGTVQGFSQFPVTGRYPNYDVREYEVQVQLDPGQEDLTPGLTAKVNLIAASSENALQVPFDAVTEVDDAYLVFVREGDEVVPHEVTLGGRSQDHVEILSGLEEGAVVVLDPRDRCQDQILAWEKSRRDVLQTASTIGE